MTAEQIRSVQFQKVKIGGYSKQDVDIFLEEIAVYIETMNAKMAALQQRAGDSGNADGTHKAPNVIEVPKPEQAEIKLPEQDTEKPATAEKAEPISDYGIQTLLIRAQRLAEEIEAEANQASEELLRKATEDAKVIIDRADSQANETLEKANAVLAEAERREASISTAARAEAENIINEAVARSGQMLTTTREKLKKEQERCQKLRNEFSQVRNVIVGFYEEQLKDLQNLSLLEDESAVEPITDETENEITEPQQPVIAVKDEPQEEIEITEDISSFSDNTDTTEE